MHCALVTAGVGESPLTSRSAYTSQQMSRNVHSLFLSSWLLYRAVVMAFVLVKANVRFSLLVTTSGQRHNWVLITADVRVCTFVKANVMISVLVTAGAVVSRQLN